MRDRGDPSTRLPLGNRAVYEDLSNDRAIRILELHGGSGDIICSLDTVILPAGSINLHRREIARAAKRDTNGQHSIPELKGYEALSWTWGTDEFRKPISIIKTTSSGTQQFTFEISPNLYEALEHLRSDLSEQRRRLWVDAICINQENNREKNLQVAMMSDIYSQATNVCVWLGMHKDESEDAMSFIKKELANLGAFRRVTTDSTWKRHWKALAALMTRPWFTRRWVVQEISLAKSATVHCAREAVQWPDFETAVALFDRAYQELSNLYRQNESDEYDAELLGSVAAMGATRLVKAKKDLFRREDDGTIVEYRFTLAELVPRLASFQGQKPHDMIYAILALARDTHTRIDEPEPEPVFGGPSEDVSLDAAAQHLGSAVNADFSDASLVTGPPAVTQSQPSSKNGLKRTRPVDVGESVSMKKARSGNRTTSALSAHPTQMLLVKQAINAFRHNALPENRTVIKVNYDQDFFEVCRQFLDFTIRRTQRHNLDILCRPWAPTEMRGMLPSWIPSIANDPFGRREADHAPAGYQTTRKNFDPLVGVSAAPVTVYNACRGVERQQPQDWKIGPHKNLHVTGFILDHIGEIEDHSQGGDIPEEWFKLAGWDPRSSEDAAKEEPPERLWRTLVADRGEDGANTKVYYPRALQFAVQKSAEGNGLETSVLLGRGNPILVEFLKRMKAVVFNRRLFKTQSATDSLLGLAPKSAKEGDCICILKGCSVPVLLRPVKHETYYRFIGECYVHTMINGKAIEDQLVRCEKFRKLEDTETLTDSDKNEYASISYHKLEIR